MTATNRIEWTGIVGRLNANYPGQELRAETAAEWYETLAEYPAERVLRAVRRCRREQSRRPDPTELIAAMLANAREEPAEPSPHRAITARDLDSPGVPPPAEYTAARERFLASSRVPEAPKGRSRARQLAELEAQMGKEAAAQ